MMDLSKLVGHTPGKWKSIGTAVTANPLNHNGPLADCSRMGVPYQERTANAKAIAHLPDLLDLARLGVELANHAWRCCENGLPGLPEGWSQELRDRAVALRKLAKS